MEARFTNVSFLQQTPQLLALAKAFLLPSQNNEMRPSFLVLCPRTAFLPVSHIFCKRQIVAVSVGGLLYVLTCERLMVHNNVDIFSKYWGLSRQDGIYGTNGFLQTK